jgi:hypothetical protein
MALQAKIKKTGESFIKCDNEIIKLDHNTIKIDCYSKVETASVSKQNATFNVSFKYSNGILFKNYDCAYDINGENPIKQAYLHLKTLPEFADAVDC